MINVISAVFRGAQSTTTAYTFGAASVSYAVRFENE